MNGQRYAGIHELNKDFKIKPFTGINVYMYKWLNAMKKADLVHQALHNEKKQAGLYREQLILLNYRCGHEFSISMEMSYIFLHSS